MAEERILSFKNRAEWSRWLSAHHDVSPGEWVLIHKKDSDVRALKYEDALMEAIRWGWIDGKLRSVDNKTHIIRFTPRRAESVWSQHNRRRAELIIKAGEMTEHGMATVRAAKRSGQWAAAYSLRDAPRVPDDLMSTLRKDKKALGDFQALANSKKHSYIYWIESAKTEKTRKKRISEIIRMTSASRQS